MDAFKPYEQSVRKAYLTLHRQTQRTMEIKEIYIKNFRNIGEEGATIKLSPVTIFTGCNSAGKSTAAKALFMLKAYLSDIETSNFNLIDTPLDFSKVVKLGSFDSVINKTAKENGHDEITLGYSFPSAILVADIKVFLTFGKKDTDALNNGWLKKLSIFIDTTELLSIFIKDGHYHLDIKDKDKFTEYIRCYKVRQIVSIWEEYEEERRASQIYPDMDFQRKQQMENLRPIMPELLVLEKEMVKDAIIRDIIWDYQADMDFMKSIKPSDILSTLENIIEFSPKDTIIYDAEKSKGCRLSNDDITMICDKIKEQRTKGLDDAAKEYGMKGNYVAGANIAGFLK
ncbi:MAG: AAA family ATPase, partial [Muribaculaceae bacterium]|nr:AAA family ATPase [Muribaculaceae bacterium]